MLSNGACSCPSRVLVPLLCHTGMKDAAKVRQMWGMCSPDLPLEVSRLGIINPWKPPNCLPVPVSLSCLGWCSALRGPVQCAASVIAVRCDGTCSALYLEGHRIGASPALRCVVPLAVQPFPVFRFLLPGEKPCPCPMCGLAERSSALRGVSRCAAWVGLWASDGCFMPFVRQ